MMSEVIYWLIDDVLLGLDRRFLSIHSTHSLHLSDDGVIVPMIVRLWSEWLLIDGFLYKFTLFLSLLFEIICMK